MANETVCSRAQAARTAAPLLTQSFLLVKSQVVILYSASTQVANTCERCVNANSTDAVAFERVVETEQRDGRRLVQTTVQVVARQIHLVKQNLLVPRVREQQRLQAPAARVVRLQRRELLHDAHVVMGVLAVEFGRAEHQLAVRREVLRRERQEQPHLRVDCKSQPSIWLHVLQRV